MAYEHTITNYSIHIYHETKKIKKNRKETGKLRKIFKKEKMDQKKWTQLPRNIKNYAYTSMWACIDINCTYARCMYVFYILYIWLIYFTL